MSRIVLLAIAPVLLAQAAFGQTDALPTAAPDLLPGVDVVSSTPLLGAGVDRDKVPAATNVLTPSDIQRTGPADMTNALNDEIPGVNIDDTSGNPFQPSLLFRGFIASPIQGDEQGLAVYVNGARFNQPFGDTVNWDLIPSNAIHTVNVEGANPVFGLNALGGSVSVQLNNGFTYHGGEMIATGGSFGHVAGQFQYGLQAGNTAAYVAADVIQDGGYRNTSASTLYQLYTDLGWRGRDAEIHFGITADSTALGNPGATPIELLAVNRATNSTAPNEVNNKYLSFNVNGNYDLNDETSVQAVLYYSNLSQRLNNGVTTDAATCANGSGNLCSDGGAGSYVTDVNGNPVSDFLNGGPYGGISYQAVDSNAYGTSVQFTNTHEVLGLPNHAVIGASFDGGETMFTGSQTIGALTPTRFVVPPEVPLGGPLNPLSAPVRVYTNNRYYGLFFSDLLSVTPKLSLSVSGRFNAADIGLSDQLGTSLNGGHSYSHVNPGIGATYQLQPNLAAFASYAMSNRAPTPSELSCANPAQPCQLPNFFIGDPNLKQVVAQTYEAGLRGRFKGPYGVQAVWNVDVFRTDSTDDIIFEYSPLNQNGGYYANAGTTRRQGVEVNLNLNRGKLHAMLGYAYVDATFQSALTLGSPSNPASDPNTGTISVHPGNHIPGVPAHRLKFIADYDVTDRWTVGASGIFTSSQYLYGDESNQTPPLPAYFVLNLNTKYRLTDHIQLFALLDNVLDAKYQTYGTYAAVAGMPAPELAAGVVTNQRAESPAAPIAAYGGVKVTF